MADDRDLVSVPGFLFPVLASRGLEARAGAIASQCAAAYDFLAETLEFRPVVALRVLAQRDWTKPSESYGMPYYEQGNLVVAGEEAGLWRAFAPLLLRTRSDLLAKAKEVYGEALGLGQFFDLLAVHELGHAFADQRRVSFPRHWVEELFCNLCLHAFVASAEPASLPTLVAFPAALVTVDPSVFAHRSLEVFEHLHSNMEGPNYGWFQCQFHVAARKIHDEGGMLSLQRFWAAFLLPDPRLANLLEAEVGAEAARVLTAWPVGSP